MPCEYTIDRARRLVITSAHGILTYAELTTHRHALRVNPEFDPTFNQLCNFTGVTTIDMSVSQVRELAVPFPFSGESRHAVVVTRDRLQIFGLLRMWETYLEIETHREHKTRLFPDVSSAMRWLEARSAAA